MHLKRNIMRNPERIPKILNEIEKIWQQYPDLRLGQLILNLEYRLPLYQIEDEELVAALKSLYGGVNND
jgi:hypothetical protein